MKFPLFIVKNIFAYGILFLEQTAHSRQHSLFFECRMILYDNALNRSVFQLDAGNCFIISSDPLTVDILNA
jgi:hypothetical protein